MLRRLWFVPLLICLVQPASALMLISEKMEIAIGGKLAKEIRAKYGVVTAHPRLSALQKVGNKLIKLSKRKGIPYSFEILSVKELNAFACPGGPIFITKGLLEIVETEAQLSAVLSHEFVHIEREHGRKAINNALITNILAAILLKDANKTIRAGVEIGWTLIELGYSRSDEKEADADGLRYQVQTGHNPYGMIELFKLLGGEEHKGLVKYLSTHPSTPERIKAIETQILKEFANQQFPSPIKLAPVDSKEAKEKVAEKTDEQAVEEKRALILGKVETRSSVKGLRVALVGFPSGDPEKGLVEICSDEVFSDGRFSFVLPKKPVGYLPSVEYNGAFHLKIYRDGNGNDKKDPGEKWLGKPRTDFILVWGQKFPSKNPQIQPGWNLLFFGPDDELTKIFYPYKLLRKEAWVIYVIE